MNQEIKPCPKFQVGQRVLVRMEEAGFPPVYEAIVCCVDMDKQWKAHYTVESNEYGRTDGYTDEWLTAIPAESRRATVSIETAQELADEIRKLINYREKDWNDRATVCTECGEIDGHYSFCWVGELKQTLARFEAEKGGRG